MATTSGNGDEPIIEIYAEVLLNIKSATLYGSIKSRETEESEVLIETDGSKICVSYGHSQAQIHLPARTIGQASATLTLPAGRPKEITSRFKIEGDDVAKLLTIQEEDGNSMPWSASECVQFSAILCRSCGSSLVSDPSALTWKDLPSDNWAEMMEFWHCHKPVRPDENHQDGPAGSKAYAASSKIGAVAGQGKVSLSTFLLAPQDCLGLLIANDSDVSALQCPSCRVTVGFQDALADGYRLLKWRLTTKTLNENLELPYEQSIAAQILSLSEASSVRKVVVQSQGAEKKEPFMLLWLFTPDVWYCSSRGSSNKPHRAIKTLFKTLTLEEAKSLSDSSSYENLQLDESLFQTFWDTIHRNASILPQSARKYQDWNVSLLQRFSKDDLTRLNPHQMKLPMR